ncbi:glycoside hydrolase family 127 protein [Cryobacterium sp. Hh7]|uniref:glycoside hydrolase family 127 protein n=1 Tax=Cryobacterium sp. Hh7 TaxID=1259159 RepID=UPI00106C91B7|nr:beta-L-arabinofuranosidase domain-containing protein [Cryobacterium sp. Hh7]TFD56949.1 glycoside hydrolase family 127 protein [Cryobacterium sp. Hh7]
MTTTLSAAVPVDPRTSSGALRPLALTDYRISGGFWADRQRLNRESIIPHCDNSLERVGWIENFRAAARSTLATERVGRLFTDSEIYKTIEAMAWENARESAPEFTERIVALTELLQAAQASDGYLNTYYGYDGGPDRYSDMEWGHELYCFGHLLQAAVAAIRTGGPEDLIDIARRVADHICAEFGEDGRQTIDGHPEIETALVELYRSTGEHRYLEQARIFVERRGHKTLGDTMFKGRDYYQDNVPVRDAAVLVGHSVRALYLAAGAIDVAVETGDVALMSAVKAQYDRTLDRRTYLTGGMGSNHHGETYGDDFELPSERAYAETCAAVASVHVAWRLLLATGETRYADLIERTLYNSIVSSPSADGRSFFYVNALQRRAPGIDPEPGVPSLRRTDGTRAEWFTTSCCPTNLARTLASLGGYLATTDDDGIQIHQYAAGALDTAFGNRRARLDVTTTYPNDGVITVTVAETDGEEWTLSLRVPAWSKEAKLTVAGEEKLVISGTVSVTRAWKTGDTVELRLDMRPRFVYADPRIDDVRGCAAVERGPLVYALESPDQPELDLDLVTIDTSAGLHDSASDVGLEGIVPLLARGAERAIDHDDWPYSGAVPKGTNRPVEFTLIPYYSWANRGASTMRVWIPRLDVAEAEVTK